MKFLFLLFVVCVFPLEASPDTRYGASDEEFKKTTTDAGYPFESHRVETEDGYILTLFRIPHGKNSNRTSDQPILLIHGMLGSAENFIILGPKNSPAYISADAGYDVWLMNCRGTWHSKKHKTLKPKQKEFWDFSWHEMGVYDLPAVVDYMLGVTRRESVFLVGHSQGGTIALVMASEKPEYNKKIKLMIGLSPGAFYRSIKNPLVKMAASNYKSLQNLCESIRLYELPPPFFSDEAIRAIGRKFCVESKALQNTCKTFVMLVTEENPAKIDMKSLPTVFLNSPGSISTKQAFHYAQLIISGNFQRYDFGPEENKKRYGSKDPPLYDLRNVKFPVVLFSGKNDSFVSEKDTKLLAETLPNVVAYEEISLESFNHFDYILAKDVKNLVYSKMLKFMKKSRNK